MIVVDTNVLVYLLIVSPQSAEAEAALRKDSNWVAPFLLRSEIRNVFSLYVKQKQLEESTALQRMEQAEVLLAGREFGVSSRAVLELAFRSGCTAYDCEFVALAKQLGVRLITADRMVVAKFPETAEALADFARDP